MTNDEIKKLAELSRLSLSEDQIESYRKDFEGILHYIDTIKSTSVDSESSLSYPNANTMREDDDPLAPGSFSKELLAAAPESEGNYIKVNKVL